MKYRIFALCTLACAPAFADEQALSVPSDSKAHYSVLQKDASGNQRTITTKREGPSGVSYSKRLYNCSQSTVKYLGSGDTIKQMKASKPDALMATIVPGSIAYYVGAEACR
ncbi:hypothetical protein ALQ18_02160 [Pseudomonas marginalis pv. marginalis]|nr:hypothetical protein ALQ18_02160 [Pseudomonas marginalis pv. marginalis]